MGVGLGLDPHRGAPKIVDTQAPPSTDGIAESRQGIIKQGSVHGSRNPFKNLAASFVKMATWLSGKLKGKAMTSRTKAKTEPQSFDSSKKAAVAKLSASATKSASIAPPTPKPEELNKSHGIGPTAPATGGTVILDVEKMRDPKLIAQSDAMRPEADLQSVFEGMDPDKAKEAAGGLKDHQELGLLAGAQKPVASPPTAAATDPAKSAAPATTAAPAPAGGLSIGQRAEHYQNEARKAIKAGNPELALACLQKANEECSTPDGRKAYLAMKKPARVAFHEEQEKLYNELGNSEAVQRHQNQATDEHFGFGSTGRGSCRERTSNAINDGNLDLALEYLQVLEDQRQHTPEGRQVWWGMSNEARSNYFEAMATLCDKINNESGKKLAENMRQLAAEALNPPPPAPAAAPAAALASASLSEMLASAMSELEKVENFTSCTPEQQVYIKEYARQMIEGGDKPEFAIAVCKDMALLYQEGIDRTMPDAINVAGTAKNDQQMRTNAVAQLRDIMKANGGDYGTIASYLRAQQEGSDKALSVVMRYFLMQQRQNPGEERFLAINEGKMKEAFEAFEGNTEEYAKTVAMYKAFTAIALNKVGFEGRNPQNHTCTVYRGMSTEALNAAYPGYDQKRDGDTFTIKHNPLESTSIGGPIDTFNGPGKDTHTTEVPFSRVLVAYFMSPEMCASFCATEHEFICDLVGIPAKIKHN
ncbi:MAG: hypothetical protein LBJ13_00720 [Puniceicoccales bacterium]|jgi:hypothetical protein|nr:hypothetical protein [Puniceicoccales bacterium]